jgi:hypothetical protein
MKISRRQLRRIIREYKEMLTKDHIDGQVWSGTLEDLAHVQGKTWGGGDVVDPCGFSDMVNIAGKYTKGTVKGMFEGVLYVKPLKFPGGSGGWDIELDDEWVPVGEIVRSLVEAGDDDIFQAPQGVDEEQLARLLASMEKRAQGGIEKWDSDVFETYYNVDMDRVIQLYAMKNGHEVVEVGEDQMMPSEIEMAPGDDPDDITNEFEEYYS